MTRLRRQMLEELERRHYSANTVRAYVRTVEDLARYFKRRPDRLGPEHIRQYQAHLFRDRKLAANTVAQRVAALRFFYIKTLGQEWNLDRAPYPKRPRRLPNILSPQEVARLIEAADSAFHRMIVMTLYATGVRRLELTQLQIHDIDSARMVVHVRDGKGGKDRDVMLSEQLLFALREHIRGLRHKPERWLFPGGSKHTGNYPIGGSTVWNACHYAAERCSIDKPVHPTFCGIASPPTCWKPGRTYAPSRCCSVIATWKRRRGIYTCQQSVFATSPARWTRWSWPRPTKTIPRQRRWNGPRWRWPFWFEPPGKASLSGAASGFADSTARCCRRSHVAAPPLSAVIACAAMTATMNRLSSTTRVWIAIVPSARPTPASVGWRLAVPSCCRCAICTSSSRCPESSRSRPYRTRMRSTRYC